MISDFQKIIEMIFNRHKKIHQKSNISRTLL